MNSQLDRYLQSSVSSSAADLTMHKEEILAMYNTVKNCRVYWKDIQDLHSHMLQLADRFPLVGEDVKQEIKGILQSNQYILNDSQRVITWQLTIGERVFKSKYVKRGAQYCTGVRTVKGLYYKLIHMLVHAWSDEATICIVAMLFVNTLIYSDKSVLRIIEMHETAEDCLVSFSGEQFQTNFSRHAAKLNEILLYLWGLMKDECTEHHLFEFARAILERGIPDRDSHHVLTWIIIDNPLSVFKYIDEIDKTKLADMLTNHLDRDTNTADLTLSDGSAINSKKSFILHFKMYGAYAMFFLVSAFDIVTIRTVETVPVLDYTGERLKYTFYPYKYFEGAMNYTIAFCLGIQWDGTGVNPGHTLDTCLSNTVPLFKPDTHFSEIGNAFEIIVHACPATLPRRFQHNGTEPEIDEFDDEYRFSNYSLQHIQDDIETFFEKLIVLGAGLFAYTPTKTANPMEYSLNLHYNNRSLIPGGILATVPTNHLFPFFFKGLALADEMIILRSFVSDDSHSVATSVEGMDEDI